MDVTTMESRIYAARFLSSLPKEVLLAGLEKTVSSLGIDNVQVAMDNIGMSSDTKQFFANAKLKVKSQEQAHESGLDSGVSSVNSMKRRP